MSIPVQDLNPVKLMEGVYSTSDIQGVNYVTKNLIPGVSVYGEQLLHDSEGVEYRSWAHNKSKLASGMLAGMRVPVLKKGAEVLYLGASSGTTVSHVSDIVGATGMVFAVEFSPRSMRDLMNLANRRENIVPILADARYPHEYSHLVHGVDLVYCDVAQPKQSDLMVLNSKTFLKKDGMGYIAVKTKSISQREKSDVIFKREAEILDQGGFDRIKTVSIHRYHREHYVYLGRWTL